MTFGKSIQNTLEQSLYASVFVQVCCFINFSSFKPDTENNANFHNYVGHTAYHHGAVQERRQNFDQKCVVPINVKVTTLGRL